MGEPDSRRQGERMIRRRNYGSWLLGLLALAALVFVVLNVGELEQFTALIRAIEPAWLLLVVLLQMTTYVLAAEVWRRALKAAGVTVRLRSLVPLGLAKLFSDQALPSIGLSGALVLAHGLARRGVPPGTATQTLLITLVSYYSAYLVLVFTAVGLLWLHHQVDSLIVLAATLFAIVAFAIPVSVLSLQRLGSKAMPAWIMKIPTVATLYERFAQAPNDLLRRTGLMSQVSMLQLSIFLLDSLTLWAIFQSLGQPVAFPAVFTSFMMASVVATIGPIPGGIGTFEASSVGVLNLLGVELETALAGTLLLRGFTLWLPMLPGLWLARHELRDPETRA